MDAIGTQRGPVAELHILAYADGNVNVNGPLQNKVLCYGILERAKDAIREFDPATMKSGIIVANGVSLRDQN